MFKMAGDIFICTIKFSYFSKALAILIFNSFTVNFPKKQKNKLSQATLNKDIIMITINLGGLL